MQDLEAKFLQDYDEGHPYHQVKHYKHYFMGSIIISEHDTHKFIIDGQQRLTSLTLLLIFLNNLQKQRTDGHRVNLDALIFSDDFGEKSFNLDIDEREACFQALFADKAFEPDGESEAVHTIVARYEDIKDNFPASLRNGNLIHFIFWLTNNVDLIEITTYSDDEAYTIFETMNDRGLSLSPTDMLKGYLLANISPDERAKANDLWKDRLLELSKLGKEEDADFFKAWLRAKYAESIRERKKGASNKDFEIIGTTYHKWIHDESKRIGLMRSEDFKDFVMNRFKNFSGHYMRMQQASKHLIPGMEYIFYNAHNNFTLQYPLMLAPLKAEDDQDTIHRKIRLVSGYLDIFIARRAVNFRTLDYSSIVYTMFNLMKEIRELDLHTLAETLKSKVASMDESFDGVSRFSLNLWSKRYIQHILARMTQYIEAQSGVVSSFETYVSREIKKPFEIEHIWANKYRRHRDEFDTEEEFAEYRNRIGDLVLLPRGFNQSLGDKPYEDKVKAYFGQNLLARSLDKQCYQNNPSFLQYIHQSGLPFRPHETFKKADLDERQKLYQLICEEIWSPARFDKELGG
ncbi:MAG TPA: hypothetical protein DHW02_19120 [Ktedonobacter sp.]|nr:hypothetical protein [Ktedonobacter sp.]